LILVIELFLARLTFKFYIRLAIILKMVFFLIFIIEAKADGAFFNIPDTVVMMKIEFGLVDKLLAVIALLHWG
jgi:hypothetical protein